MTELTEIDGVGPSYAEELEESGYESAEDVATTDEEELDGVLDTLSGAELVANASGVAETDDSDPAKEETYTLEPGFSVDQENHAINALVSEEINARASNNGDRLEATRGAIIELKEGEPYELTLQQISIAYRACNQLESEYRGTRGLSTFVGQMREVTKYFQETRQEHWPDS